MFSSQNEQDTRHYARMAKIPCLEPVDSDEARGATCAPPSSSPNLSTRPSSCARTTRISTARAVVQDASLPRVKDRRLARDVPKYVMLPGERQETPSRGRASASRSSANTPRPQRSTRSGPGRATWASSQRYRVPYVREAFPDRAGPEARHDLPDSGEKVRGFAASVKKLAVVEELDGFVEELLQAMGITVPFGKTAFPPVASSPPGPSAMPVPDPRSLCNLPVGGSLYGHPRSAPAVPTAAFTPSSRS